VRVGWDAGAITAALSEGSARAKPRRLVRRLGCPAAGPVKNARFVSFQQLDPVGDVAPPFPNVAIKTKFLRTGRRAPSFRESAPSACVVAGPEPVLQIAIEAILVPRPMRQLVERHGCRSDPHP